MNSRFLCVIRFSPLSKYRETLNKRVGLSSVSFHRPLAGTSTAYHEYTLISHPGLEPSPLYRLFTPDSFAFMNTKTIIPPVAQGCVIPGLSAHAYRPPHNRTGSAVVRRPLRHPRRALGVRSGQKTRNKTKVSRRVY